MEQIWNELYKRAKALQNPRDISERISVGGVAAAIESAVKAAGEEKGYEIDTD